MTHGAGRVGDFCSTPGVFGDRRERRQIIKRIGIPFLRALWDLFPDRNLACAKPAIGGCERKQLRLWIKYVLSGEHLCLAVTNARGRANPLPFSDRVRSCGA